MSLATRCTACGTAFRVVQDQLKVSEGWVRCGRCDAVFNALEGLFDLERTELHDQSLSPSSPDFLAEAGDQAARPDDLSDRAPTFQIRHEAVTAPELQATVSGAERLPGALEGSARAPTQEVLPADSLPTPEFLRQPQPDSHEGLRRRRLMTWTAGTVLSVVLTAQAAHHFRDAISAHWPSAMPTLVAWCKVANCTVGVLRRISDVAVESSALTRVGDKEGVSLAVVLRNHGRMAVALPSLELSLTDPGGHLLARRVLNPGDFQSASTVASGAVTTLQVNLTGDNSKTAGYAIEIFYP